MLELVIVATGTALATGLGAVPVFLLGRRAEELRPLLLGVAAGVMGVAAIAGLLKPALDESDVGTVGIGVVVGVAFLLVVRRFLLPDRAETVTRAKRTSLLVFAVLFVHSLPEGLALGTAWASSVEGLATFIVIAIAVQNVPEGTSVAIPMEAAGYGAPVSSGRRSAQAPHNRSRRRSPTWRSIRSARCCPCRSRSRPGRCWLWSRLRSCPSPTRRASGGPCRSRGGSGGDAGAQRSARRLIAGPRSGPLSNPALCRLGAALPSRCRFRCDLESRQ